MNLMGNWWILWKTLKKDINLLYGQERCVILSNTCNNLYSKCLWQCPSNLQQQCNRKSQLTSSKRQWYLPVMQLQEWMVLSAEKKTLKHLRLMRNWWSIFGGRCSHRLLRPFCIIYLTSELVVCSWSSLIRCNSHFKITSARSTASLRCSMEA